jgi:DNA-binding NarL/FixJ family response regulator
MAIDVCIIDDTKHVLEMLASLLELDGFNVVGKASAGTDAVQLATSRHPDVMVIDYSMPEMNGLEASRRVLQAVPGQSIILYTAYVDDALRREATRAGVAICIGKAEGLEALERSISELCLQLGK